MNKQVFFWILRLLVGGLFVFSGLIKINDPVGTAIKLEEYFDVFSNDIAPFFHLFKPYALPLSVFLVVSLTLVAEAKRLVVVVFIFVLFF